MRKLICLLLLILFMTSPVSAEENEVLQPRKYKVNISVVGEASESKGLLYDCIEQNLNSIQDIEVVYDGAYDYAVFIMFDTVAGDNGNTLVVAPDYITRLKRPRMLMDKVDEKYKRTYEDLFSMMYFYPRRSLFTVPAGQETAACETIVGQFTEKILKMTRQFQPGGRALQPIH